jgi:hypothetical protein
MARQLRHLPAVDAAFTSGAISQTHVAVIARTARQIGVEHVAASQDALPGVALTELCRRALDGGTLPQVNGKATGS